MDRSRHTLTKYLNDEKTHNAINEPLFKRLKTVEKDLYDVELLKTTIEHREFIIVGNFTSVCKTVSVGPVLQFL